MIANNATRKPRENIKDRPITVQIRMPNSVRSQVLHANRKALPPMVDIALQTIGDPVMKTERCSFDLRSLILEAWYACAICKR